MGASRCLERGCDRVTPFLVPAVRRAQQPLRAMNEKLLPPLGGVPHLRNNPNLLTAPKCKVRVAVFGSFHGGYHVLSELLQPPLAEQVTVVGVATDDITQPFVHADVRLWKYPHTRAEELLVPQFAGAHGLPVYTDRVKTQEFERMFVEEWKRSEEHTSELQSLRHLVCRLLLE